MIAIKADLQGIEESIVRPILIIAVDNIKTLLGLSKDIFTFFDSKDNLYKRKTKDGGLIGDNSDRDTVINIEHDETSEDGNELSLVPARPNFKPIYKDDDIGSIFTPVYHNRKITIHFKLSAKSKSKIFSIANKIRLYNSTDSMYCLHDFEYFYTIPNFLNKLLLEINNLKNKKLPDGEKLTFEEYLDKTFDERLDFGNTMDADITKSSLVIREKQLDVEGWIDGDLQSIKPEYDESGAVWYIEFDFTFVYEKPVTILVKYPILIYNSIIRPEFRTVIYSKEKKDDRRIRTGRMQALYDVTKREQDMDSSLAIKHPNYYIKVPEYDTDILPKPLGSYVRLMSILTIVDDNDPTLLFNLDEIPNFKFRDTYRDFLVNYEKDYIGGEYSSIFSLQLWKNNKRDYNNPIILEEDGTLRSTEPLDNKQIYRVSINLISDLRMLLGPAKDRLKEYVRKQLETNDKTKSLDEYIHYWQHINWQHIQQGVIKQVATDNIITDWISLFRPDVKELEKILTEGTTTTIGATSHNKNNYPGKVTIEYSPTIWTDILLSKIINIKIRTVQINSVSAIFEEKK